MAELNVTFAWPRWGSLRLLRGHVLDGSGAPVIGARLDLAGDASAVRYTDFTGGFTFHLDGGDFRLNATALCPLSPAVLEMHGLTGDATYAITADTTGTACVSCPLRGRASPGFIRTLKRAGVALADVDALVLAWGTETDIAVGDTLVSFQALVDPATPQEIIDLFFATARNFTPEELPELFSP